MNKKKKKVALIINGDEDNPVYLPKTVYDAAVKSAKKQGISFDEWLSDAIRYMMISKK